MTTTDIIANIAVAIFVAMVAVFLMSLVAPHMTASRAIAIAAVIAGGVWYRTVVQAKKGDWE